MEATLVTYLLLDNLVGKKPTGNILRAAGNALSICGTTLDKLIGDHPELKNSVDTVLQSLALELNNIYSTSETTNEQDHQKD